MDKQLRYREKHVHDLPVEGSLVRLWDAEGAVNGETIRLAFQPLLATGLVWPYVALMPDYHPGEGSMIGSVIPTRGVVLLTVVGGDLGCGMTAVRLPIHVAQVLSALPRIEQRSAKPFPSERRTTPRSRIACKIIPSGKATCGRPFWPTDCVARCSGSSLPWAAATIFSKSKAIKTSESGSCSTRDRDFSASPSATTMSNKAGHRRALTRSSSQDFPIWSPAVGLRTIISSIFRLCWILPGQAARKCCFAHWKRRRGTFPNVADDACQSLADAAYNVHHNFVAEEEHFGERLMVHRKGAIRLAAGEVGLVPGSMGTNSYVVEGRGNPFALNSCSHGAGRAMSRADAFRTISDKRFADSLQGVVHQHDARMKDEAPGHIKTFAA